MIKTYQELISIPSFEERFEYLRIGGKVGDNTFGSHRYLNQLLYNDYRWKKVRRKVILRDDGYDLAHAEHPIKGNIYVHHINPISIEDVLEWRLCVFDLENLISTSFRTHNAIHYGDESILSKDPIERIKNDTCPWK